jgi:hypothetical protein
MPCAYILTTVKSFITMRMSLKLPLQELQKKLQFSDQALYSFHPPVLPAPLGQFLIALNITASETEIGFLLREIFERQNNHMIMAT